MKTYIWNFIFVTLAFSILLPVICKAQPKARAGGPTSCPISIEELRIDHNIAYFWYFNTSAKDVDGVLFDAAYYDEQEQAHHIQVWGNYNDRVHPGHFKEGALNIKFLREVHYAGLSLWPTMVRYRDGSTSDVNPGLAACATERRGKRETVGVVPPASKTSLFASNGF